jgi:hypothetical protein
MQTDRSRKFLNFSAAISMILCSLSLLVYSLKSNSAKAAPSHSVSKVAGVATVNNHCYVIGYSDDGRPEILGQMILP